ncbi:pseudaminic acid cytidylyltransferase [Chitinophaga sp. GbtcB8]|uniref:pseudaminic acid cytidylyltransferase n=1 Tax=Chitinophaga sp. GbtcB8 TaxID=2824753 RepID=UPI001C2FDC84|nr:pseudaminic acid cytidylyltransferase [Chitinophaga sp. GbtcB8]
MHTLAIITARGGSKRIPGKNIKDFLGKPIIAYSIETARASGLFDEIMVSTDDENIAAVAKKYGAVIPFLRSEQNANDFATTAEVLVEVLEQYKKLGQHFTHVCCIYPCAPFITGSRLKQGFDLLLQKEADAVFPVMKFHFPIQRAIKINNQGLIEMFQPEHLKTRSQDLEPAYCDSGQFYWLSVPRFLEKKAIWTDNTAVIVIPEMEGHDIDNLDDWKVAEIKYRILNEL